MEVSKSTRTQQKPERLIYLYKKHFLFDNWYSTGLVRTNQGQAPLSIMSNHFHIVLKINTTKEWNATQVLMTWSSLYSLPVLCDRYLKGEINTEAEIRRVNEYVAEYRTRLMSVSWYMKAINEYVARMANEEDKCTGHFWESRFKSQALLDEKALLTCMAYVDLNPIRAGMAKALKESAFTSIQERIEKQSTWLSGFGNN